MTALRPGVGDPGALLERFIVVDDAPLSVLVGGSGRETLVFVHGWATDRRDWSPQLDALRDRFRVVALDQRGFGRSEAAPGPYSVGRYADDLAGVIAQLERGPVNVVGHSMGAVVGLLTALRHPELVRALISVDPSYGVPPGDWADRRALVDRVRRDPPRAAAAALRSWVGGEAPAGTAEALAQRAAATADSVLLESLESLFSAPDALCSRPWTEEALRSLRCPVLALHGEPEAAVWEAGVLGETPNQAISLAGAGHWLQLDRPGTVSRLITEWMAVLRALATD